MIFSTVNYKEASSRVTRMSMKVLVTRKRGNCECIATWDRPSHASPFPLFTTPCQVWSRWTYLLPYHSVFIYIFIHQLVVTRKRRHTNI